MARGAAFDLDLEYAIGEAIGDEMQAAKQTLLLAPCMNLLAPPAVGPRAGDLRRGSVPHRPPRLGDDRRRAAAHRRQRQALHGLRHRERPRQQRLGAGRADAAGDLRPSLPDGGAGRRRRLRHGVVQHGERHEVHAERAHADRRPAHRLRVQGLRPQRLVGDAAGMPTQHRHGHAQDATRSRR